MKNWRQHKALLLVACLVVGAAVAVEIWSWTYPTTRMTANGRRPDPAACDKVKTAATALIEAGNAKSAEVQDLTREATNTCDMYEQSLVVGSLCGAYPDACMGKLEEELND